VIRDAHRFGGVLAAVAALCLQAPDARAQASSADASVASSAGSTLASAAPAPLHIPAQDLPSALRELGRQTGISIGFSPSVVRGLTAPAVQGRYTAYEAAAILLADTGLSIRRLDGGALIVESNDEVPALELPEVQVTGWRIPQTFEDAPSSIVSHSAASLRRSGPGTLMDGLSLQTRFINNATAVGFSDGASGSSGASYLNLRGIGQGRTLVLVDGRRVVPSTRRGYVDISLLPESLIERVDVVTGGASAAYGSDAVSGVANVVLETNLTGWRLSAQEGITSRNDNRNGKYSAAFGTPIGSRAHLILAGERYESEGIESYDSREWFRSWGSITNPDPDGPREITVPGLNSRSYTHGGLIVSGPLANTQFLAGGVPAPFEPGTLVGTINQQGGSGFDAGSQLWITPDLDRTHFFSRLAYEVADDRALTLQAMHARSKTRFASHPQAFYTTALATIQRDNAFLPRSIGERMDEAGISSFMLARMSSSRDIGAPLISNTTSMDSFTLSYDDASGSHTISAYYQFGRSNEIRAYRNVGRLDRLYRAVDSVIHPVTGQPVCRSTLLFPDDGCIPLNLFGDGSPSQAAKDYVLTSFEADQVVTQHVLDVSVSGMLARLPYGFASFAAGVSYRTEAFDIDVLPRDLAELRLEDPAQYGYSGVPTRDLGSGIFERASYWRESDGSYRVMEGFVETLLPLLADVPMVSTLNAALAARFAHYTGSGGVWTWKTGLDWRLDSTLRFHLTRSRDMRAGNLAERFDLSGAAARVDRDPANPAWGGYGIFEIQGGNPNVRPEKAETLTYGVVYQPLQAPGLSLAVDFFDVKIDDAIAQLGVQAILDQCHAGEALACSLTRRDPVSGQLIEVRNLFVNVAQVRTRGVDIEMHYVRPVRLFGGHERIELHAGANRVFELSTTVLGGSTIDRAGQTGRGITAPDWRANVMATYTRGPLEVFLEQRYIAPGVRDVTLVEGVDIDDNSVSEAWYTSIGASYRAALRGGEVELYCTVNNLLDTDPPRAPTTTVFGTTHTNEELFDPLGRRYAVGLRFRF
jgi:iron complex outermembrane receptor protein